MRRLTCRTSNFQDGICCGYLGCCQVTIGIRLVCRENSRCSSSSSCGINENTPFACNIYDSFLVGEGGKDLYLHAIGIEFCVLNHTTLCSWFAGLALDVHKVIGYERRGGGVWRWIQVPFGGRHVVFASLCRVGGRCFRGVTCIHHERVHCTKCVSALLFQLYNVVSEWHFICCSLLYTLSL